MVEVFFLVCLGLAYLVIMVAAIVLGWGLMDDGDYLKGIISLVVGFLMMALLITWTLVGTVEDRICYNTFGEKVECV
jgi:ABC-type uncharacterized transport system permease subunit